MILLLLKMVGYVVCMIAGVTAINVGVREDNKILFSTGVVIIIIIFLVY